MKKSLLFLAFSMMFSAAHAQVRGIIMEKANEKIRENKQEKNTSDTTQKAPENNPQQPSFTVSGVASGDIRIEYIFTDNVLIEVKAYKKNGEQDGETHRMKYHFGKGPYLGMELEVKDDKKKSSAKVFTIADLEKSLTIMLNDDGKTKTGFAMKNDHNKMIEDAQDTTKHKATFTKTGRTKVILGYTCEEYIMIDENKEKSEIWFTKNVPLDLFKSMTAFSKGNQTPPPGQPSGFMMEMTHYEANGEKTEWKVVEINLGVLLKIISADYTFIGLR